MSYMGLAGWSSGEMTEGLDGILNFVAAPEMDLTSALDIVMDHLSALGLTAAVSGTLVDKMAYAMNNSNTSTEQLGKAYKRPTVWMEQVRRGRHDTLVHHGEA